MDKAVAIHTGNGIVDSSVPVAPADVDVVVDAHAPAVIAPRVLALSVPRMVTLMRR
jgi:hypothetical protein